MFNIWVDFWRNYSWGQSINWCRMQFQYSLSQVYNCMSSLIMLQFPIIFHWSWNEFTWKTKKYRCQVFSYHSSMYKKTNICFEIDSIKSISTIGCQNEVESEVKGYASLACDSNLKYSFSQHYFIWKQHKVLTNTLYSTQFLRVWESLKHIGGTGKFNGTPWES
jgi:hypothetical protein